MVRKQKNNIVRRILVLVLWLMAMYCMASFLGWTHPCLSAGQMEIIALVYLFTGLVFLFLDERRLLLVCFACSASVSFLVHEQNKLKPPPPVEQPDTSSVRPPLANPFQ